MGLAPLDADPWIKVVQLARSQRNGLKKTVAILADPTPFFKNYCISPCSHACQFSGSQASPSVPRTWKVPPL